MAEFPCLFRKLVSLPCSRLVGGRAGDRNQVSGSWATFFLSHLAFLCATMQPALTWPQGMPKQPPHPLPSHEQVRPRDLSTGAGNVLEWACPWVSRELALASRIQGQHVPSETSALPIHGSAEIKMVLTIDLITFLLC